MITASADPAVAMRFPISAWLRAVASNEDLWDCEAEERDEIAESIEEVRGTMRCPDRPPGIETDDMGEDVADWFDSIISEAWRDLLKVVCSVISLSF
jgi:hypothetical protein